MMNTIEELYEGTTGVTIEDAKSRKKVEYICELEKIKPSKNDLKKMIQDTQEKIRYYQTPEAEKNERKDYFRAMGLGIICLNIIVGILFLPMMALMWSGGIIDGMSILYIVVAVEIGILVMFGLFCLVEIVETREKMDRKISDLKVAMMAMTEYEMRVH